jgi:fibronectin-binding autotransporter adhesin
VTLAGATSIGGSGNYTLSGPIAGAVALTKVGNNTITLTNDSNASTTTTISGGTLQIGNGSTTGVLGSGAVTNNGTLIFNRSNDLTVSNVISGTGSLQKLGSGVLTLSGTNSYTGSTTISAGTLSVATLADGGSNSNIGASTNVAGNLVFDGGTLRYTGAAVNTNRLFTISDNGGTIEANGTGALNFNGVGSIAYSGTTTARSFTLTGTNTGDNKLTPILANNTGATSLTKSGAGTWWLSGANTYTGGTTISAGILKLGNATGLGGYFPGQIHTQVLTTITAGTLSIGADANLGAAPGSVTAGSLSS